MNYEWCKSGRVPWGLNYHGNGKGDGGRVGLSGGDGINGNRGTSVEVDGNGTGIGRFAFSNPSRVALPLYCFPLTGIDLATTIRAHALAKLRVA